MMYSITKNQYLIEYLTVIAVSSMYLIVGLFGGISGPMITILEEYGYNDIPPISRTLSTWIVNSYIIGISVGSIVSSYMSVIMGRKFAMLIGTIPQVASVLFLLFANNVYVIYVSCILRGLYMGLTYSNVPIYVSEVTSAKLRGPSTVFGLLILSIGGLIGGIVQSVTTISRSIIMVGISSICTVPLLFMIPESPYYFMSRKQDDKCKSVLQKLRRTENVENEFFEIQTTWNELEKSKNVKWADLFTNKKNLRVLLIVMGIQIVQEFTGYVPLYTYCTVIINETKLNLSLLTITLLINFVNIISTTASIITIESLGRRKLYFIICTMSIFSLGIVGTTFYLEHFFTSIALKIIKIFGMLLLSSAFGYGISFFANLLAAELFSSDIKAKGLSLLIIEQSILGPIVALIYHKLYSVVDYFPFFLFCITTLIGLISGYFFVPETKNKTLAEIQKELN